MSPILINLGASLLCPLMWHFSQCGCQALKHKKTFSDLSPVSDHNHDRKTEICVYTAITEIKFSSTDVSC